MSVTILGIGFAFNWSALEGALGCTALIAGGWWCVGKWNERQSRREQQFRNLRAIGKAMTDAQDRRVFQVMKGGRL